MSAEKKIILYLITQSELGGAQRYVFDLAKNLKNEFAVAVACGEPWAKGELAKQCQEADIQCYFIPHLIRRISPFYDLLALFEIIKLIKHINPDIIHLNSSKVSIIGSIAYRIIKILRILYLSNTSCLQPAKIIYTAHGWVFNEPLPFWQKFFYHCAEKWTARWKDKIICVSEFDRQAALKEKIAPTEKLLTIPNGLEQIKFMPKEKARRILLPNSASQISCFLIGSIGNLYKTKGYEYLIKAIALLINHYRQKISAVIIGEGKERKNLEKLINSLNLSGFVFLAGKIENASRLLPAFDIYVCASVKEGLSYTLMEAMQAGLPIIAAKVGGNPELIADGHNGWLVEPADEKKLAEKIMAVIKSESRENYGQIARRKELAEFNLEKMIKKTKSLYL